MRRGAAETAGIATILLTSSAGVAAFFDPYWSALVGSLAYLQYQNEHNSVRFSLRNIKVVLVFGFVVGWLVHTGLMHYTEWGEPGRRMAVGVAGFLAYDIIKITGDRRELVLVSLVDALTNKAKEVISKWKS